MPWESSRIYCIGGWWFVFCSRIAAIQINVAMCRKDDYIFAPYASLRTGSIYSGLYLNGTFGVDGRLHHLSMLL